MACEKSSPRITVARIAVIPGYRAERATTDAVLPLEEPNANVRNSMATKVARVAPSGSQRFELNSGRGSLPPKMPIVTIIATISPMVVKWGSAPKRSWPSFIKSPQAPNPITENAA